MIDATKERKLERERVFSILSAVPTGDARYPLAISLACESDLAVDQALKVLKSTPGSHSENPFAPADLSDDVRSILRFAPQRPPSRPS
jgi:hypothetical protein